MTRRGVLIAALHSALSPALNMYGRIQHWWEVRVRRRWDLANFFARSGEGDRRCSLRFFALYERLEAIDVDPSRREELQRDLASIRSRAERYSKYAAHYSGLAASYRRAAFRPWREAPRITRPEA